MDERKDFLLSSIEKFSSIKLKTMLLVNKARDNVKRTYTEQNVDGGFYDDLKAAVRCFDSLAEKTLSNIDLLSKQNLGNLDIALINSLIEKYNLLHDSQRLYCADISTNTKQTNEKRLYILSIIRIIEELNTYLISLMEPPKNKLSAKDKIVEMEGCDVSFNITQGEIIIDDKSYKPSKMPAVIKSSRSDSICKILYGIISKNRTTISQNDDALNAAGDEYVKYFGGRKGHITNLSYYISDINKFLKELGSRCFLKKHGDKTRIWMLEKI